MSLVASLQNWEIARTMPQGFAHNAMLRIIAK